LAAIAAAAGADCDKFLKSLTSGTYAEAVKETVAVGKELGVDGTPTFFINGRKITGAAPYEVFAQMIEEELARPEIEPITVPLLPMLNVGRTPRLPWTC